MTITTTEPRLVSSTQVCAVLGISLSTLDRLVEQEVLEPVRLTPRAHRRFRVSDLAQLIEREGETE